MFRFLKLIIFILLIIVVGVFSAYNNQSVAIDLFPLPIQFEISLFIVVFVCIVFGVLISGVVTSLRLIYWKRVAKNAQKSLAKIEAENKKNQKAMQLSKHEG